MAFTLGTAFANSLLSGEEAIDDGGVSWVFLLIVFPLSHDTDQEPEQPR